MHPIKHVINKIRYQILNTNLINKYSTNKSYQTMSLVITKPYYIRWTNRENKKEPILFAKIDQDCGAPLALLELQGESGACQTLFEPQGESGACLIEQDPQGKAGLKKYMTDIYIKSCDGFLITLAFGSILPMGISYINPSFIVPIYIGNFIFSFHSLHKMRSICILTIQKEDGLYEQENKIKNNWYKAFSVSNGITISPLCAMAFEISPLILPIVAASTVGVFGTGSAYAVSQPDVKLIKYRVPLIGCVGGLIGSSLIQIIGGLLAHPEFTYSFDLITTGASTLIFTGLIVVDTQKAIEDYDNKQLDSVKTATELLFNSINLFIDQVKILIEIKKKED